MHIVFTHNLGHTRCNAGWQSQFRSLPRIKMRNMAQIQVNSFHNVFPLLQLLLSISQGSGLSFSAEKTICTACHANQLSTPFYCPMKPDLPQCITPICPQICEVVGVDKDPGFKSDNITVPYAPASPHMFALPPYFPKAGAEYQLAVPKQEPATAAMQGNDTQGLGRTFGEEGAEPEQEEAVADEDYEHYDEETCDLKSPFLKRLSENSKYIIYNPPDAFKRSYSSIQQYAGLYGLVMGEITRSEEQRILQDSSVLQTVASYDNTKDNPRIYIAYGLTDAEQSKSWRARTDLEQGPAPPRSGSGRAHGEFKFLTNPNKTVSYAVIDPRQFGKTDQQCGVLTHVTGSDKKHYLITKFRNCDEEINSDGSRDRLQGLLMYPPGSLCYNRSEEECKWKTQFDVTNGKPCRLHNMIQIGQTLKRFIYFYSDQRTWDDARQLCEVQGLTLLDFHPKYDDALRTYQVVEHFLRQIQLNPVTMFWTAGKFTNGFADGQFRWMTPDEIVVKTYYKGKPAPFPFEWWDDQKPLSDLYKKNQTDIPRRPNMHAPCVALALNPEDGNERPKINFKSWYCDFPSFFLCYKEINATDKIDVPLDDTYCFVDGRAPPSDDACEPIPPPETTVTEPEPEEPPALEAPPPSLEPPSSSAPPLNVSEPTTSQSPPVAPPASPPPPPATKRPPSTADTIEPFDPNTCTSKSTTATRLSSNSKFVDFRPKIKTYTVEQVKQKCVEFGLVSAEISTVEDWKSVVGSGIGGVFSGESDTSDYFYTIGIDDKAELGKFVYSNGGGPAEFTMFYPEGNTDIDYRCVVVDSVPSPDGQTQGLMMKHANCEEGTGEYKVAYGLCMFPRDSKCFKSSSEEKEAKADVMKGGTIISLGVSSNRSVFWNPVQRTWSEAKKFCEAAELSLLDFDRSQWNDAKGIIKLFRNRIAHDTGLFQLTPLWTSGKIQGTYPSTGEAAGVWDSTQNPINFQPGGSLQWIRYRWMNLTKIREGAVQDGCVEASLDDYSSKVKLRPSFCDVPKYFLCYRKSRARNDPPPLNTLGIYIIDTGDLNEESDEDHSVVIPEEDHPLPRGHMFLKNQFHHAEGDEEEEEEEEEEGDENGTEGERGDFGEEQEGDGGEGEDDVEKLDLEKGGAAPQPTAPNDKTKIDLSKSGNTKSTKPPEASGDVRRRRKIG